MELEKENARLKKLVAELSLDRSILKEIIRGTSKPGQTRAIRVGSSGVLRYFGAVCAGIWDKPDPPKGMWAGSPAMKDSLRTWLNLLTNIVPMVIVESRLCCKTKTGQSITWGWDTCSDEKGKMCVPDSPHVVNWGFTTNIACGQGFLKAFGFMALCWNEPTTANFWDYGSHRQAHARKLGDESSQAPGS